MICHRERDGASDILTAEGVRGDFASSAPKARKTAQVPQEEAACAGETIERRGGMASPHNIRLAAKIRSFLAAGHHPIDRRDGSLSVSQVISRECRRIARGDFNVSARFE